MPIIKTKGIVLLENSVNDYDKMITMLTPNLGKISCSAKGARKNKSSLLASSQFLCFGEYILYKNPTSDIYNINSCDIVEVFYELRTDLDKLEGAAELTRIIRSSTNENENSEKVLQLFLNTLFVLAKKDLDYELVKAVFQMRLLTILGYCPHISNCTECGKTEKLEYFSFKDNGFKCNECTMGKHEFKMSETTKNAIMYSILADPKKLYSFSIDEDAIKEFKIIADIYLKEKFDWK